VETEPLLAALPWVGGLSGLGAVDVKIEVALSALVRGTLASELAAIANKASMTIGAGGQDKVMWMTLVLARLGQLAEVGWSLGLTLKGGATTRSAVAMATSPPGTSAVELTCTTVLITATLLPFSLRGFRGVLEVKTQHWRLLIT
jgi:hypothetical protein